MSEPKYPRIVKYLLNMSEQLKIKEVKLPGASKFEEIDDWYKKKTRQLLKIKLFIIISQYKRIKFLDIYIIFFFNLLYK